MANPPLTHQRRGAAHFISHLRYCAAISLATAVLAGCGAGGAVFGGYDLPDSDVAAEAPWPRLVDAPASAGSDAAAVDRLDPATGAELTTTLSNDANAAARRAARLTKR